MNLAQKIARKSIKRTFQLTVRNIEFFSDMQANKKKVAALRELDAGTLGREIVNCLDEHKLTLVPNYESHDLKHVVLGYKMTPDDEIRMQAFMVGNGNYSVPSFLILTLGVLLLPEKWSTFRSDFQKGRRSNPISDWTLETNAHRNLKELQDELAISGLQRQPRITIKRITKIGAFTALIAGVFGMTFCLPFLFSSNLADLVGAGFPFIGGAILAIGGLLTLSNLARKEPNII